MYPIDQAIKKVYSIGFFVYNKMKYRKHEIIYKRRNKIIIKK